MNILKLNCNEHEKLWEHEKHEKLWEKKTK